MVVTGLAFGLAASFAVLLVVAALGTINPSGGDVSPFLPIEQSLLPDTVPADRRTHVFARYTPRRIAGRVRRRAGRRPARTPRRAHRHHASSSRSKRCSSRTPPPASSSSSCTAGCGRVRLIDLAEGARHGLHRSRGIVLRLAGLFSVDSFGGGFTGQAILVLWLSLRFDMSTATAGAVFFWSGLLTASSALLAPRLASRIGLIRTMVYTHLPANLLVISRRAHAHRRAGGRLSPRPRAPVADGRAGPDLLRHGDGGTGGAGGGGQRHQRPAQPRRGASAAPRRLAARPDDVRLAAGHRWGAQGRLRPRAPAPLPRRPPA